TLVTPSKEIAMHHFPRIVRRNTHTLLHQASHQLQEYVFNGEDAAEAACVDGADEWRARSGLSSSVKSSVAPSPGGLVREPRKVSWQNLNQATSPPTPIASEAVGAFRRSAP